MIDAIKKQEDITEAQEQDMIDAWLQPEPHEEVRDKKFNRLHKRRQL